MATAGFETDGAMEVKFNGISTDAEGDVTTKDGIVTDVAEETSEVGYSKFSVTLMIVFSGLAIGSDG